MKFKVTYLLGLILLLTYSVSLYLGGIISKFGVSKAGIYSGEIWTLITSVFLHSSLFDLVSVLIPLLFFGYFLEEYVSWKSFISIFFLGAIFTNIFYVLIYSLPKMGAYPGIFAIFGALLNYRKELKERLQGQNKQNIVLILMLIIGSISLLLGFVFSSTYYINLFPLLIGLLMGYVMK